MSAPEYIEDNGATHGAVVTLQDPDAFRGETKPRRVRPPFPTFPLAADVRRSCGDRGSWDHLDAGKRS
jgi:hypothetical protein